MALQRDEARTATLDLDEIETVASGKSWWPSAATFVDAVVRGRVGDDGSLVVGVVYRKSGRTGEGSFPYADAPLSQAAYATSLAAPNEGLGYVERTAGDIAGVGVAADLAGMTITFTTDGRPFEVWFDGMIRNTVGNGISFLQLLQGAVVKCAKQGFAAAAGANPNPTWPVSGRRVFNLPAGQYTFKLQAGAIVAGTTTVFANVDNPLCLGANYR